MILFPTTSYSLIVILVIAFVFVTASVSQYIMFLEQANQKLKAENKKLLHMRNKKNQEQQYQNQPQFNVHAQAVQAAQEAILAAQRAPTPATTINLHIDGNQILSALRTSASSTTAA